MRPINFWGKLFFLISVTSICFVLFDLQVVPVVRRVVRGLHAKDQKLKAQVAIPAPIPFESWDTKSVNPVPVEESLETRAGLSVVSFPEGARVTINEKLVGSTPFEGSLPLQEDFQMSVSLPGYFPESRTIRAESTKKMKYVFHLRSFDEVEPLHMKSAEELPAESTDELIVDDLKKTKFPPLESPTKSLAEEARRDLTLVKKKVKEDLSLDHDMFYTVQVESLEKENEATYRAALYQAMGFPAYVCSADVDQKRWFRVRIGEFPTKLKAEKVVPKIQKELTAKTWVLKEDGLCPKLISATPWELFSTPK